MATSPLPLTTYDGPFASAIQLLIVQPTPFYNIQCDYCYLPDRDSLDRLKPRTFRELLIKVIASGLVQDGLSVIWHAGEPLAIPLQHYRALFAEIAMLPPPVPSIRHSIQTNGIPLTPAWCDFIREQRIHVGISIDGPAFIHNRHRKDRQGRGTHDRVMKGVELLRTHDIDFHVIAVITADSLEYADAIFDFFLDLGVKRLGFNVEELEGTHVKSSLTAKHAEARLRTFWTQLYRRQMTCGGRLSIREFEKARHSIVGSPPWADSDHAMRAGTLVSPLAIVTADWQGNISSFSPELLGLKSARHGEFAFGNIFELAFLQDVGRQPGFAHVASEIEVGVRRCAASCEYFSLCGGGAPSNKFFENGSFDSTETAYCRTSIQMPIDIVLADLEHHLGLGAM